MSRGGMDSSRRCHGYCNSAWLHQLSPSTVENRSMAAALCESGVVHSSQSSAADDHALRLQSHTPRCHSALHPIEGGAEHTSRPSNGDLS